MKNTFQAGSARQAHEWADRLHENGFRVGLVPVHFPIDAFRAQSKTEGGMLWDVVTDAPRLPKKPDKET